MRCEVTPERRIDFVYGELPPAETAAIEAHLAECESCRRECEELAQQVELVDRAASDSAAATAPADLARIFAAVRSRETRRSRRWRRAAIGAAAALLMAIAAAAARRVEVHATHVVIRWGEAALPAAPQREHSRDLDFEQLRDDLARTQAALSEQRRRLDELDRLAALVVSELKDDDARLARITFRIDALKRQNDERWQAVGRGFHGWYLTHVESPSAAPQTEFSQQGDLP